MSDGAPTATHAKEAKQKQQPAQPVAHGPVQLEEYALLGAQRAVQDPTQACPADILALQRAAGNRVVSRLIQAKLTVGPPGDQYEQDADRVAEQVLSMPTPTYHEGSRGGRETSLQRQDEEEEVQMKPDLQRQEEEEELQTKPLVQRQEEEEEIQTKPLVQRQEDEEEVQTKPLLQRQEEEEELQMKPDLQRQEEEEELQMKPDLQRQEDEEEIQTKPLLQRQGGGGSRCRAGESGAPDSQPGHRHPPARRRAGLHGAAFWRRFQRGERPHRQRRG